MILGRVSKTLWQVIAGFTALIWCIGVVMRSFALSDLPLGVHLTIAGISLLLLPLGALALVAIHLRLNHVLPIERALRRRVVMQLLVGILFGTALQLTLFAIIDYFHIPLPLNDVNRAIAAALGLVSGLAVNTALFASHFFERWQAQALQEERLKRETAQVRFDNLKNQLNPHFLFNSLTSLSSLIFENQQLAADFLQQLSKVYRYVLQHKTEDLVTLQTELDFIQHYIALLETRFGAGLVVHQQIEPAALLHRIPPVTLQVLIENAIKHNVATAVQPLSITIATTAGYLWVRNSLQHKSVMDTSNKQGLANLRQLYQYLSPLPVQVLQQDNLFQVGIPLL